MVLLFIEADHSQRLALALHLLDKLGGALQRAVEYQYIDAEVEFPQEGLTVRHRTRRKCLEASAIQGSAEPESVPQVFVNQQNCPVHGLSDPIGAICLPTSQYSNFET